MCLWEIFGVEIGKVRQFFPSAPSRAIGEVGMQQPATGSVPLGESHQGRHDSSSKHSYCILGLELQL